MRKILLVPIAIALIAAITVPILVTQLDWEDPIIINYYPTEFKLYSGVVAIGMEAEDNSGTVLYSIYVNDELVSTSNTYDWDTTTFEDGSIVDVVFKAEDKRGNFVIEDVRLAVDNFIDSPRDDVFKVMAYNIWESGEKVKGFNGETRPKGAWRDVMEEESADIVILVETGTLDDSNSSELKNSINRLNTYFYDEAPYSGYAEQGIRARTDGQSVLSRYPILEFHQIIDYELDDGSMYHYSRYFCDAVINISGTITHVIGYHGKCCQPSPLCNTTRMRENETEGIINYLDDLGDVPVMFMGDFNSHSPDDIGDLAPLGWLGDGPLRMLLYPEDPVYGQYSSHVHNFTDVYRTINPTSFGPTFGYWEPQYWGRIDYIIVNHHWADKMINSTAGDTLSANMSSDHYSVDCFFSLDENYSYSDPVIKAPKHTRSLIISENNPLMIFKQRYLFDVVKTKDYFLI